MGEKYVIRPDKMKPGYEQLAGHAIDTLPPLSQAILVHRLHCHPDKPQPTAKDIWRHWRKLHGKLAPGREQVQAGDALLEEHGYKHRLVRHDKTLTTTLKVYAEPVLDCTDADCTTCKHRSGIPNPGSLTDQGKQAIIPGQSGTPKSDRSESGVLRSTRRKPVPDEPDVTADAATPPGATSDEATHAPREPAHAGSGPAPADAAAGPVPADTGTGEDYDTGFWDYIERECGFTLTRAERRRARSMRTQGRDWPLIVRVLYAARRCPWVTSLLEEGLTVAETAIRLDMNVGQMKRDLKRLGWKVPDGWDMDTLGRARLEIRNGQKVLRTTTRGRVNPP